MEANVAIIFRWLNFSSVRLSIFYSYNLLMKRRNFITNTSLLMAGLSVPMGLSSMATPSVSLSTEHAEMLDEFRLTLAGYPGDAVLKARLSTVYTIEHSDASTLRFRSLSGERIELRRKGKHVVCCLLA